jgi:hypothetical protein
MTTAGLAVLKPFGLRGEIGLGTSWAQPFDNNLESQYGLESYWKLLLLPSLWVTPGVQVILPKCSMISGRHMLLIKT